MNITTVIICKPNPTHCSTNYIVNSFSNRVTYPHLTSTRATSQCAFLARHSHPAPVWCHAREPGCGRAQLSTRRIASTYYTHRVRETANEECGGDHQYWLHHIYIRQQTTHNTLPLSIGSVRKLWELYFLLHSSEETSIISGSRSSKTGGSRQVDITRPESLWVMDLLLKKTY